MLKRLIEVALPLKEVSEQSAREKSIRHGHISTLHIWWARRPLAACRAAVFASLIPDPDDPECPESFRTLVMEVLGRAEFKPKVLEPLTTAPVPVEAAPLSDTPRNRCLEFIKHLVRWENSNKPEYIEPARKLIAAAHKILHPRAEGDAPKVLDPFAGGGAIPLEALRLGCEAHAIDLNPVAHLIELCTLVYPQKYGQPDSRPVPDYIKRLIAHNRAKRKRKGQTDLFEQEGTTDHTDGTDKKTSPSVTQSVSSVKSVVEDDEIIPEVEITEAEYRQNPLAADVKYWGHWVLEKARREIGDLYPSDADGNVPIAYLWARTVKSPVPTINATIPLIRQLWLCKKTTRKIALRMTPDNDAGVCKFTVVEGKDVDFDPDNGTMRKGQVQCPFTHAVLSGDDLRKESKSGRMGETLIAVVTAKKGSTGKQYRKALSSDQDVAQRATILAKSWRRENPNALPNEAMTPDRPSPNSRGLSAVVRYGFTNFGKLFNDRQCLAISRLIECAHQVDDHIEDKTYCQALRTILALVIDWFIDKSTTLTRWHNSGEKISGTFSRQALPMVWDYAEVNPFSGVGADFLSGLKWTLRVLHANAFCSRAAQVQRASATRLPFENGAIQALITDPPYYDSVPYSDLSDFFYVWLKRSVGDCHPHLFRTPLTPKSDELIAYWGNGQRQIQKPPEWYEHGMALAFQEANRIVSSDGVCGIMFAHKTTTAWESAIAGLLKSGIIVTASWPLHTEMKTRMVARNAAALASSVTLIARKRLIDAGTGLWDDVRQELKQVANERLDFFWNQSIRGADFFISAIGPALSVFGKYERVTKLSGEEVTVGQFLDEVRALVTSYALAKILHTTHTAAIDPESRFYVVWKWSYGDAKVPADESFKLAQALDIDTELMWDKTGVLDKSGENVQAVPVARRMKMKNLGEPSVDGAPASLIDVLHRLCAFRDRGDNAGMAQFLARSGQAQSAALWLVAQAISEILPDGEREKQLLQGLLNQKESLEEATRQGELF